MSTYRSTSLIDTIILHCADTPNGAHWSAADIDDWHRERKFYRHQLTRGQTNVTPYLKHIGYHFVIETTGTIVAGRSLTETGAHAKNHNTSSIGICLVGTDKYTIDQWHALKMLVKSLQARLGSDLNIIGHRDVDPHKTCPGFDVRQWLDSGMGMPLDHLFQPPQHLTES